MIFLFPFGGRVWTPSLEGMTFDSILYSTILNLTRHWVIIATKLTRGSQKQKKLTKILDKKKHLTNHPQETHPHNLSTTVFFWLFSAFMVSRICITITTVQIQTPGVRTSVSPEHFFQHILLSKQWESGTTNGMNIYKIYTLNTNIYTNLIKQ